MCMSEIYPYLEENEEELRAREQELSSTLDASSVVGSFGSGCLYNRTLQGKPIHALIASSTNPQNMQIDAITRAGTINSEGVIITIEEEALLDVSPQTFKVLIMLLTKATEQLPRENQITPEAIIKGSTVKISLEEYMNKCGIKDKKSAREQLNTAVRALYGISLEWDEPEYKKPEGKSRKVKETVHHAARILEYIATREGGNPVKRGEAEVWLTRKMAEYLSGAYIMPYPSAIFEINTNNHPYSIPFCWKLCSLYNINWGKPTQGRTKVETLLRAAKGIPRYETIAHRGNIYNKIIRPFDRDMKELVERGILSGYYYYDDMGARVDNIAALSYLSFSGLHIWYELNSYPSHAPRIEAKQKRIEARIRRAQRTAAKRKGAKDQTEEHR